MRKIEHQEEKVPNLAQLEGKVHVDKAMEVRCEDSRRKGAQIDERVSTMGGEVRRFSATPHRAALDLDSSDNDQAPQKHQDTNPIETI